MWRRFKNIYKAITILAISLAIFGIGTLFIIALFDRKLLSDSIFMNTSAITLGFLSLPGLLIQLVGVVTINEKKKFIATMPCQKCKHLSDIVFTEADN
ncbi:hypothetical protein [Paenibacillus humicus]|uniref:hypothetical protein n=1 Tax=Paenibacillus humicus TaxID=412861 RepID=UPI003F160DCE